MTQEELKKGDSVLYHGRRPVTILQVGQEHVEIQFRDRSTLTVGPEELVPRTEEQQAVPEGGAPEPPGQSMVDLPPPSECVVKDTGRAVNVYYCHLCSFTTTKIKALGPHRYRKHLETRKAPVQDGPTSAPIPTAERVKQHRATLEGMAYWKGKAEGLLEMAQVLAPALAADAGDTEAARAARRLAQG